MSTNHYTYQVSWSPEDGEYVGTVAEFPSLSWLDTEEPRQRGPGLAPGPFFAFLG